MVERHEKESVLRGHHVYKHIWTPQIGEELVTEIEEDNYHDSYAVAVMLGGITVGHLPREMSRVCYPYSMVEKLRVELLQKESVEKGLKYHVYTVFRK